MFPDILWLAQHTSIVNRQEQTDMEPDVKVVGGSQIGWVSVSWPFAKLVVSKHQLTLSCLGTYVFEPQQIVALEPHGFIPFFAQGVRIVHSRADYPAKMIFWYLGSPEKLISRIRDVGFLPQSSLGAMPPRKGAPFRWAALITAILVWNALFLLGNPEPMKPRGEFGWPALLATGLLCATTWALPHSQYLQSLVLKPKRSFDEIKSFIGLLRLVSTVLFVAFAVLALT